MLKPLSCFVMWFSFGNLKLSMVCRTNHRLTVIFVVKLSTQRVVSVSEKHDY